MEPRFEICLRADKLDGYQNLRDWSDTKLAEEMGVSRAHLWKVRHGKAAIGKDFVAKLMAVTGFTFDELFYVPDVVRSSNTSESGARK